jgi:disease resistance protein RPM1
MGAIDPLLGKLSRLITEEHAKLKNKERKEVIFLKEELGGMVGLFRGSAMVVDPDVQVKEWMRQVREVAYDTEDWLDIFLHDQLRREQNFLERLSPMARSRSKRLVQEIRQLRDRIVAASERRTRYKLVDGGMPSASEAAVDALGASSVVAIDPRLLHREEAAPVAIDGPKEKLAKLLLDERHLRIVSIVGMAGIGKTTLAKQVYRSMMMGRRFHCQAFVYVGQSPSVRAVLMDILRQVFPQALEGGGSSCSLSGSGEIQAIAHLRDFLQDKR